MKAIKHDFDMEKIKTPRRRENKRSSVRNTLRKLTNRIAGDYDEGFLEDLIDYDMILDR